MSRAADVPVTINPDVNKKSAEGRKFGNIKEANEELH
jgi:hypothetical protein